MNDRLTNEELRRAIRETLADANRSVGPLRDAAVEHLATLRMVERNRATALLAAAEARETREPNPGEIDRYYLEQALDAAEARTAELQAKLDEAISRAIDAEASAADWRRISDLREHDIADLRIKFSAAARLARETAGEAMAVVQGKTCVWVKDSTAILKAGCCERYFTADTLETWDYCPHCGGEIVKGGE